MRKQLGEINPAYRAGIQAQVLAIADGIPLARAENERIPESYYAACRMTQEGLDAAAKQLQGILGTALKRTANENNLNSGSQIRQSFQAAVRDTRQEADVLKISFDSGGGRAVARKQLKELSLHFGDLANRTDAPAVHAFAQKAWEAMEKLLADKGSWGSPENLRGYMQGLVNQEQELLRLDREGKDLYEDYCTLALLTGREPEERDKFPSVGHLRQAVAGLQHLYRKQDEMDYMADQINAAMVDLGYTFVTSRVLTKKDQGETDFSLYQADNKTGISVYTDQSGGVMMRMTVLGDDPAVSEEDRAFSYQRQIDFCACHGDIVAALAERGVLLKQKNYQEPDRAHTYKLCVGTAQSGKMVQLNRRDRRRAGKQKMRKMQRGK